MKGYVRGFDARTGKRLWIFHTIPQPGEFGIETWLNDSWSYTGNTGVWAQISVDEQLGLAYLPVELPTGDYYGGHRPGNGLFGESLVAVDLKTGQRKWHYQLVHHGLWDMDIPCAPILADIVVNGRAIKAVAQPTKQAFLYVFDRVTGQPVWPIEERPVAARAMFPASGIPRPSRFPPSRRPMIGRASRKDDLIEFTPELHAEAVKLVSKYKLGPLFTPPVVSKLEGPLATLRRPAPGGTNWPGGAYDPETHMLYVFSQTRHSPLGLVPPAEPRVGHELRAGQRGSGCSANKGGPGAARAGRDAAWGEGGGTGISVQGLPLLKPPYGRITAINLDQGENMWQIAHGETPDNIRNNPALKGVTIPRTGRPGIMGTLVTKSLVIAGEAGFSPPSGAGRTMLDDVADTDRGWGGGAVACAERAAE